MSRPRVLIYAHNVLGLGHVMRCLAVSAAALEQGLETCLVTGCPFLDELPLPPELEVKRLPSAVFSGGMLRGRADGAPEVMARREAMILDHVRQWRPGAVLVDHLPLGLAGEMTSTLLAAGDEAWPTHFYWGMRDVVGDPGADAEGLPAPRNPRLRRALQVYHGIMIYSSPGWLDGLAQYAAWPLPDLVERVGVIAQAPDPLVPDRPGLVAALAGGGSGAGRMLTLFREALALGRLPKDLKVRLVLGPFASAEELPGDRREDPRLQVLARGRAEEAMAEASVVVCRAGYNTAYAAAASDRPVVFVPLANEGGEQPYRARRLADLERTGLVDENQADAVRHLAAALEAALKQEQAPRRLPFALDGARRAAEFLAGQLAG